MKKIHDELVKKVLGAVVQLKNNFEADKKREDAEKTERMYYISSIKAALQKIAETLGINQKLAWKGENTDDLLSYLSVEVGNDQIGCVSVIDPRFGFVYSVRISELENFELCKLIGKRLAWIGEYDIKPSITDTDDNI